MDFVDKFHKHYHTCWKRFKSKKDIYNACATHYKRLDIIVFVFPLLVLQIAIAVVSSVGTDA